MEYRRCEDLGKERNRNPPKGWGGNSVREIASTLLTHRDSLTSGVDFSEAADQAAPQP